MSVRRVLMMQITGCIDRTKYLYIRRKTVTINIYQADAEKDKAQVETLFLEYLDWACAKLKTHYDVDFDSAAVVKGDMESLSKFMPPSGYLFLCEVDGKLAGTYLYEAIIGVYLRDKTDVCAPRFSWKRTRAGALAADD